MSQKTCKGHLWQWRSWTIGVFKWYAMFEQGWGRWWRHRLLPPVFLKVFIPHRDCWKQSPKFAGYMRQKRSPNDQRFKRWLRVWSWDIKPFVDYTSRGMREVTLLASCSETHAWRWLTVVWPQAIGSLLLGGKNYRFTEWWCVLQYCFNTRLSKVFIDGFEVMGDNEQSLLSQLHSPMCHDIVPWA